MATAPLSSPRSSFCSLSCFRPLIPLTGSSLLAVHAYHRPPTSTLKITLHTAKCIALRTFGVCWLRLHPLYRTLLTRAAVLRDISAGTSYQTVRLVFRPYAHVTPSNCTSEWFTPSNGFSTAFSEHTHSSLSFGLHQYYSPFSHGYVSTYFASQYWRAPWSVFQYGSDRLGFPHTFAVSRSNDLFSSFLRSTFSLSVSLSYLALDAITTYSHCTTKQHYSSLVFTSRGYHPLQLRIPSDYSVLDTQRY